MDVDEPVEESAYEREARLAAELEAANAKAEQEFRNKFDVSADYDATELANWLSMQQARGDLTDEEAEAAMHDLLQNGPVSTALITDR